MSGAIEDINLSLRLACELAKQSGLDWRWLEKRLNDTMVDKGLRKLREFKPAVEAQHFEDFWRLYPRKVDKAGCQRKWASRNLDAEVAVILLHVARNAEGQDWIKEGGKFCPMPATYLNQRRWEGDEVNADPFGLEGAL